MIPLYKPFMPGLPKMDTVLHSGALAYGEHSRQFEQQLADYFDSTQVLATSSFNFAISVALAAIGALPGDEIIASPMACLASTQPYHTAGMKIVWADIDPARGTLDPESVKAKITGKTKCIVHNHFCGYPGHIDEIAAIGKDHGIDVIDDGIECFGSRYKGQKVGTCSDIAVFSFNPVRLPNTVDGGAVLLKDKGLYEKGVLMRDCGIDRRVFRDEMGEISPTCDISSTGFSATISNLNGYIGSEQMKHVEHLLQKQGQNMLAWNEQLSTLPQYSPLPTTETTANGWVYGLLAKDKKAAIAFFREKGFFASGVHINNNRYSVFGPYEKLPGVEAFNSQFLALPSGWWVDEADIRQAVFA